MICSRWGKAYTYLALYLIVECTNGLTAEAASRKSRSVISIIRPAGNRIAPLYDIGYNSYQSPKQRRAIFSIIKPHSAYGSLVGVGGFGGIGAGSSNSLYDEAYAAMRRERMKSHRPNQAAYNTDEANLKRNWKNQNRYQPGSEESAYSEGEFGFDNENDLGDDGITLKRRAVISIARPKLFRLPN